MGSSYTIEPKEVPEEVPEEGPKEGRRIEEGRWLPSLAIEVPIWRIGADLNRRSLMDGALLLPETTGPEALPTKVEWDLTGLWTLEEAREREPEALDGALLAFLSALERSAAAFEEGADFARFRAAFSVPELELEGGRFYRYDPKAGALRVWNWGARPRTIGARAEAIAGPERLPALIQRERSALSRRRQARAGELAEEGGASSAAPGRASRGRRGLGLLLLFLALLACTLAFILWPRPDPDPGSRPEVPPALSPDAGPEAPRARDAGAPRAPREEPAPPLPAPHQKIFFEVGEHSLSTAQRASLAAIRAYLEEEPRVRSLLIEGHADFRGAEDNNMSLSQRRAEQVKAWLVGHGVAEGRLRTVGCSELYPLSTDRSARGRRENRRVEFFVLAPIPAEGLHRREGCEESL